MVEGADEGRRKIGESAADKSPADKPQALRRFLERAAVVTLLGLLWLSLLDFPAFVAGGDSLDSSWQQALGYFLTHRFQAGVDYIFTYGPLGYFHTTAYIPELFWWKYAWEIVMKAGIVVALGMLAFRARSSSVRVLFCIACLACLPEARDAVLTHHTDSTYNLFLFLLGALPFLDERLQMRKILPVTVLLAVLSLVKFTLMVAAVGVVGIFALGLLFERRPSACLLPPLLYGLIGAVMWLGVGQGLANVPSYLAGSLQIAGGYSEAMALEGNPWRVVLGLVIVVLLLGALLPLLNRPLSMHPSDSWRSPRTWLKLALLGFFVFMAWMHGLVRNDIHAVGFFNFTLALAFVLPVLFGRGGMPLTSALLFALAVPLSLVNRGEVPQPFGRIERGAREVFLPWALRHDLAARAELARREFADPELRAIVGNATIDEMTLDQHVLFVNELNYRPRPVFQSYSAYTPWLLERNAEFFRSARAPRYLLFDLDTIDDRLPGLDDGPALREVLRRYMLRWVRAPYLLLEKRAEALPVLVDEHTVLQSDLAFGEFHSLAGMDENGSLALHLDLVPTVWGRLRTALFRPPPVFIDLVVDGAESEVHTYRLIPSMATSGFLVNPYIERTEDVRALYEGGWRKRVDKFRVRCPDGNGWFGSTIKVWMTQP